MSFYERFFGAKSKPEPVYLTDADRIADGVYPVQGKAVEAPRADVPATRQWVDDLLNTKLVNVVRVDGDTHRQLLRDAPAYYLYTAKTKGGTRIGRLFKGRGMGLALPQPIVFGAKNQPGLPDTDSLSEYQQWRAEAENKYNMESIHTSTEDWGNNSMKVDVPQDQAMAIIAWAVANNHYIW